MRMNQLCEGTENYKNNPVWIVVKSLGFGNQMPCFKSKFFHFLREVTKTFYASVFSQKDGDKKRPSSQGG